MKVTTQFVPAGDGQEAAISVTSEDGQRRLRVPYPHQASEPHYDAVRAMVGPYVKITLMLQFKDKSVFKVTDD